MQFRDGHIIKEKDIAPTMQTSPRKQVINESDNASAFVIASGWAITVVSESGWAITIVSASGWAITWCA